MFIRELQFETSELKLQSVLAAGNLVSIQIYSTFMFPLRTIVSYSN